MTIEPIELPTSIDDLEGVKHPFLSQRFFGNQKVTSFIKNLYKQNKLHHALLFKGTQGLGKETLAFKIAYNLIAKKSILDPVEFNNLFYKMVQGACKNFLYITRSYDDNNKVFKANISIDEIRKINKTLSFKDSDNYKVIIINSIDDLNNNSANALLKILEEPPQKTVFILISHLQKPILPTIKSRCFEFNFLPLAKSDILSSLNDCIIDKNLLNIDLNNIDEISQGNVREAAIYCLTKSFDINEKLLYFFSLDMYKADLINELLENITKSNEALIYIEIKQKILNFLSQKAIEYLNNSLLEKANKISLFYKLVQKNFLEAEEFNINKKSFLNNIINKTYIYLKKIET